MLFLYCNANFGQLKVFGGAKNAFYCHITTKIQLKLILFFKIAYKMHYINNICVTKRHAYIYLYITYIINKKTSHWKFITCHRKMSTTASTTMAAVAATAAANVNGFDFGFKALVILPVICCCCCSLPLRHVRAYLINTNKKLKIATTTQQHARYVKINKKKNIIWQQQWQLGLKRLQSVSRYNVGVMINDVTCEMIVHGEKVAKAGKSQRSLEKLLALCGSVEKIRFS